MKEVYIKNEPPSTKINIWEQNEGEETKNSMFTGFEKEF